MTKTTRIALAALAALALPAAAAAQTTPAPAQPAPAAPAADEATQLRAKLAQLQEQALQDPAIKAAQDSFTAVLNTEMARLDPAATAKLARANSIQADVAAARAANDNARLNALASEASELQSYFNTMRPRTNAVPAVVAARQAWLTRLFTKMKEIDPNAQSYVDRLSQSQRAPAPASAQPSGGSN